MGTRVVTVGDSWQQVAIGAAYLDVEHSASVRVHFGNSAPDHGTEAYHRVHGWGAGLSYGGTQRCYARTTAGQAKVVVTEGI